MQNPYKKYFLVKINDKTGETLNIERFDTLKQIQKKIKMPMNWILSILYGKDIHKNYRIQLIDNWVRWDKENKDKCLFKI